MVSADDEVLLTHMTQEIRLLDSIGVGMAIQVAPLPALQLAGLLQLCLRHPDLAESHRATALILLDVVTEFFQACPAIAELIARGNNPAHDVPATRRDVAVNASRIILPDHPAIR